MSNTNKIRRGDFAVRVETHDTPLDGRLAIPDGGEGLVIFAHGLGHGTTNPTDHLVAAALYDWGIGTLLVDLLSPGERAMDERTGAYHNDHELLTRRLRETVEWTREQPILRDRALGLFGTGTGATAAMLCCADWHADAQAIVCRSGRLDLAMGSLRRVQAPTLLVVGELDRALVHVNRTAMTHIRGDCEMVVIPGATRRSEEPEALRATTTVVRGFFGQHLRHPDLLAPATRQSAL